MLTSEAGSRGTMYPQQ